MNNKKEKVYSIFNKLDIKYTIVEHKAIFSEKDSLDVNCKFEGVVCKNLFLKEKKGTKFYLVSLPLHKKANIKELENKLNIKKLTFGNEEELLKNLNIKPGSVSILNIIDAPNTGIYFLIDKDLLKFEKVCFHPNDNTASVSFDVNDLEKILNYFNAKYEFIEV